MAQRSQLPEFGNWDSGENVQYTTYFDNATRAIGERSNPNDPLGGTSSTVGSHSEKLKIREGVVVTKLTGSPLQRDVAKSPIRVYDGVKSTVRFHDGVKSAKNEGEEASTSKHRQDLRSVSDNSNMRKHLDSPSHQRTPRPVSSNSPLHQHQGTDNGSSAKRNRRNSTGSERRIDSSPLHPHQHSRTEAKSAVVSSPAWEIKGSPHGGSHGLAPLTPGRSRPPSVTRAKETPDQSTAVPKFGEWDESNPDGSQNYTGIFNKVRNERESGEGSFQAATTDISHSNSQNRSGDGNSKRFCCCWWKK